tara:strand:+ start:899 stop:1630 length:732 start_codon:yes stop_codon:yes gene_type:complete
MFKSLKNHPFAVEAFFENSTVLTFAVPKEELEHLIPDFLNLDSYNGYAFIAIALVKTTQLRPKGFPKFMGNNFTLVGFRIFVTYKNKKGKRLRGLYILKSETNKKKMAFFGNIFTHYKYTTTDFSFNKHNNHSEIISKNSKISINFSNKEESEIPINSPFKDWKTARRYAGPLPFTFTTTSKNKEVLIIQGVRQNWKPEPITINNYDINFLKQFNFSECVLASAFQITNIPYYWKKGEIELWN